MNLGDFQWTKEDLAKFARNLSTSSLTTYYIEARSRIDLQKGYDETTYWTGHKWSVHKDDVFLTRDLDSALKQYNRAKESVYGGAKAIGQLPSKDVTLWQKNGNVESPYSPTTVEVDKNWKRGNSSSEIGLDPVTGEFRAAPEDKPTVEKSTPTIDQVLEERGKRYGVFSVHADITQNLKHVLKCYKGWDKLSNDKKEALEMIMHKIGRIINGDSGYKDSWTDIVGYAKLVEDSLI